MYRLRFLWIGRTQEPYLHEGQSQYLKKLAHYAPTHVEEIRPAAKWMKLPIPQRQQQETRALTERLRPGERVVLLDERGKSFRSEEIAQWFEQQKMQALPQISFVIGGAFGVERTAFPTGTLEWSLSPLTFNHQMVRLILLEQVYRAFTILNGEPYHHR
jgi:23S rRNA (pseudouridine1915-N3)-methyltransferase